MGDLWRLQRASNLLIAGAGVIAGGWIALGELAAPKLLGFAAVSAIGLGAAGNVANDLQDVAADRVNRPDKRPIAAGRVSRSTAHLLAWLGILFGLGSAALVSGWQLVVGLGALPALLSYSRWLKPRGLPGNLGVGVVAGLPLYYGALAVGRPTAGLVPWTLAAWIHFARELVKDLEDEAGDRAAGRQTIPVRFGRDAAMRAAIWTCAAFVPVSVVLPLAVRYRGIYYLVALLAQSAVVVAALWVRRRRFAPASRLLKVAMIIGLLGLVLGRMT